MRRLLHDIDLARIAPLSAAEKRTELNKLKESWPPYVYKPFRMTILDTLNVEAGPLAVLPRTPWKVIEVAIKRCAKSFEEEIANLRAAESLYRFACDYEIVGTRHEFYPLVMDPIDKLSVSYWSRIVISIDKRPVVPFFDPRKSNKLTPLGRRFAQSAMHQRIRVLEPDFVDVELAVFQFSNPKNGPRVAKPYFAEEAELIDYETLLAMVRETYAIWNEILEAREEQNRRNGQNENRRTGTDGFKLTPPPESRFKRRP